MRIMLKIVVIWAALLPFCGNGKAAAQAWTESQTGMEFVRVAGGCFQMGQVETEKADLYRLRLPFGANVSFGDETPRHEVCVDEFYMGKHEVTVGAFRVFIEETGYRTEAEKHGGCQEYQIPGYRWRYNEKLSWREPGFKQNDNEPVVCVSWDDSKAFADWLSGKDLGHRFRLATEAEWEFAARQRGNDSSYAAGSNETGEVGWYVENSPRRTSPVGTRKGGEMGIHDLSGNVWEWVADFYSRDYYRQSPGKNPVGPEEGSFRVTRGGGWNSFPWNTRVANRERILPSHRDTNQGFRVVFTE